jgi:outer membrane receptor protein involved in Fe transport
MKQFRWRRALLGLAVAGTVILLPRLARAQTGRVSGVVTDAGTGQPIEGVQVVVQGTGFGALSQANGRYFVIGVPPGTYTISARRIGYATSEVSNVAVRIDATREVNFSLSSSATQLLTQRITAPPTPLVERGVTGSTSTVSTEVIEALPVTTVSGILSLQQGFLQVPQNTDIVSFSESRRSVQTPLRVRGGRGGETLSLIDGIPVNNIVFGGPAFELNTFAIQQFDLQTGGFEPQYGNALSGIINIATREGGDDFGGALEYQGTGLAGTLGSTADELRDGDILRGYLSGPIPGTTNKLRFLLSGQLQNGADDVYEFDNDVTDFDRQNSAFLQPEQLDLFPGWRAGGFDQIRDIFGKLTFQPTATSKLNLAVLDYGRSRQNFDFDYLLVGFDPFAAPSVNSLTDTLGLAGFRNYRDVAQYATKVNHQLYSASFDQRFGRSNLRLRAARFDQSRNTCNYFQGVCLGDRFADVNFNDRFVAPGVTPGVPLSGTDVFYGGEEVTTYVARADLESQVTDHHNLQGGIFFQQHDLVFQEAQNIGTNVLFTQRQRFAAKPIEFATYLQDRIEYDFLTVKLGFRFDYGLARGTGFANPLDPNNGTTAREVCNGTAESLGATTPFEYTNGGGQTFTGVAACTAEGQEQIGTRSVLLDSAMRVAQRDDFQKADARVAFSPRIGLSFPLSERSSVFFNFGRYAQNPLYNNLYQNTGIGTTVGAGQGVCGEDEARPGSTECTPQLAGDLGGGLPQGNPNLLLERSTQYEVGFASEIGSAYALQVLAYTKDNTGLSGYQASRPTQDIGTTYDQLALANYNVLTNQDYATTRGVQAQFKRRITDYWGYDINYSYSRATTNAPPPDRSLETGAEGDPTNFQEVTSEIDQPHVFNASLFLRVGERTPGFRYGGALRNSFLTITQRAFSGLPYTPTRDFNAIGSTTEFGEPNTSRGPASFITDVQIGKDFSVQNLRYGLFGRVTNLFDQKNCVQVYTTTGRCDAGVIDQRRSRQGNSVTAVTSTTFYDRPNYFGPRRQIWAGVRANF